MDSDKANSLANLFAKMFIARPDIKAIQLTDGSWRPEREPYRPQAGFTRADLVRHILGQHTYGHYMVAPDDKVKLFAFDLDLEKPDLRYPEKVFWLPTTCTDGQWENFEPGNPREFWMNRTSGPARLMLKYQMRMLSHEIARHIQSELEIPVAVAYSGSKGVHIYGFTGPTTAQLARKGASIVLDAIGKWDLARGTNFFTYNNGTDNPVTNCHQFSLEIYPKQDTLANKDLGNLMRLPLGVNLKSPRDPAFFVDLRTSMTEMKPMDPYEALTTTDPWR